MVAGLTNSAVEAQWSYLLRWSALLLALGAATATFSSFQITALRREASEKQELQYQLRAAQEAGDEALTLELLRRLQNRTGGKVSDAQPEALIRTSDIPPPPEAFPPLAGLEPPAPGLRSVTIFVPAGVPSLFHSSEPLVPSSATKKAVPLTSVREAAPPEPVKPRTSCVLAAVPLVFHSSAVS